jgi:hypothetical protein
MTLFRYHDVGLVKYKAFDLGRINTSIFDKPVEHLARRSDHYLFFDLRSACHYKYPSNMSIIAVVDMMRDHVTL